MEAIGRQPSAVGDVRGAMILAAALVEGLGFAGVGVAFILAFK
jgi:F0F1-type ATP synthase membrane subunit c/vacuolar-type H+-ATPase subunit K